MMFLQYKEKKGQFDYIEIELLQQFPFTLSYIFGLFE